MVFAISPLIPSRYKVIVFSFAVARMSVVVMFPYTGFGRCVLSTRSPTMLTRPVYFAPPPKETVELSDSCLEGEFTVRVVSCKLFRNLPVLGESDLIVLSCVISPPLVIATVEVVVIAGIAADNTELKRDEIILPLFSAMYVLKASPFTGISIAYGRVTM